MILDLERSAMTTVGGGGSATPAKRQKWQT
jgi:hypothetical protein